MYQSPRTLVVPQMKAARDSYDGVSEDHLSHVIDTFWLLKILCSPYTSSSNTVALCHISTFLVGGLQTSDNVRGTLFVLWMVSGYLYRYVHGQQSNHYNLTVKLDLQAWVSDGFCVPMQGQVFVRSDRDYSSRGPSSIHASSLCSFAEITLFSVSSACKDLSFQFS